MLTFGVLGPLQVLRDGHALLVNGPKQRALLATLLLRANMLFCSVSAPGQPVVGRGSPAGRAQVGADVRAAAAPGAR